MIDTDKILRTIGQKGFAGVNSPASMVAQFGASLIPTADKFGNVKKGGMTAAGALKGAGVGAQFGGPWGAAAGAVIGGATSFIKANKLAQEQQEQDKLAKDLEKKNFMQSSRAILSSYPRSGVETGGFYRKGGFLGSDLDYSFMDGGQMNPIANGVSIAKGRTHEQGGIKLYDGRMNKFAEIEDDEVVKGTKVYSDTLKAPKYLLDALKSKR